MKEIETFYKDLFSNKDHLIKDVDLNHILTAVANIGDFSY